MVISDRALGRATLARQLLLERSATSPREAIDHLVGLQAQNPLDPYLALWSRLEGFDPHALGALLESRELVRIVVMRGTIHLIAADDARRTRPLVQPVLDAEIARHSEFAPLLVDVDLAPVLPVAHELLAATPMSAGALRSALEERFPDLPAAAVAYACRCHLPLVQIPPRGVWGRALQVTSTPLDAWTGRPLDPGGTLDELVLRYLAAFGPATVADVTAWCRLTGMREVVERLRPQLLVLRDERGRELFDLPEAPRPPEDVPAPIRLLPEYDNALLSHADRTRFRTPGAAALAGATGPVRGTALVDGVVRAVWHSEVDRRAGTALVVVEHDRLPKRTATALQAEARRMAAWWHEGLDPEVRLIALG